MTEQEYLDRQTLKLTPEENYNFSKTYSKKRKSEKVAFLLWLIGGIFGLHRVYLRRYGTALIVFGVTVFTGGIGAVAGLYDVTNIKRITFEENHELILQTMKEVKRK